MTVYLSGGMQSNWREEVFAACPTLSFVSPQSHGLDVPGEYTAWDLLGVRHGHVLFAYLEADNASGIGLSLEVGYAKALNKLIIFVDEKPRTNSHLDIVRATADVCFGTLAEGIRYLRSLTRLTTPPRATGE